MGGSKKKRGSQKGKKKAGASAPSAAAGKGGKFKVNIVVPMAGRGSRFANVGFVQPKPNIDVAGKPMITYVLENVDSPLIEATFVLLILKEQQDKYDLIGKLGPLKPRMEFVVVDEVTEGAACTALLAKQYINNTDPMFVVNSDQFVEWSADDFWRDRMAEGADGIHGNILCFHVPLAHNDTKWSYAKLNEEGFVIDVQEKKVISENATVGFYYWKEGADFVQSAEEMIKQNFRVKGEFYVAPVYNFGVNSFKRKYTVSFCAKMWGLGVPADLVSFLSDYHRPRLAPPLPQRSMARSTGPLRFISRAGNLEGPCPAQEQAPAYVQAALALGLDVQVDVWCVRGGPTQQWFLGNDGPVYPVDLAFLMTPGLWLCARDACALQSLLARPKVHVYSPSDDAVVTSQGLVWMSKAVSEQTMHASSIVAHPLQGGALPEHAFGVCQDDVLLLRRKYNTTYTTTHPDHQASKIKLVVFDLDGVLVDSKEVHYEALNQALLEVAGADFVIQRAEHESVYDGLSTDQKLRMLMVAKNLSAHLHKAVWTRKQELTLEMVGTMIQPTQHVTDAILNLKKHGYPVAVCSNCIRASVQALLRAIGLLGLVDVYLSNEDVVKAKPEPDLYTLVSESFGVQPHEVLVVEDSKKGFEACLRSGAHLLKVRDTRDTNTDNILQRIKNIDCAVPPITVLMPLAGPSPELWLNGPSGAVTELPLFLVDAAGEPVLQQICKKLRSRRFPIQYVFLIKSSQKNFKLESMCMQASDYAPTKVVYVNGDTLGALNTVLNLPRATLAPESPVLVVDGHQLPIFNSGQDLDDLLSTHHDGAMTTVSSEDARFAYVRADDTNIVSEVMIAPRPQSNTACAGFFFYRRARDFYAAADAVLANNNRFMGRFFIASTFNHAIAAGQSIAALPVQKLWSLRTLEEIAAFSQGYFKQVGEGQLNVIYSEMTARQAGNVAKDGCSHDIALTRAVDDRRCLALYCLCSPDNFSTTKPLLAAVAAFRKVLGDDHCYYQPVQQAGPEGVSGAMQVSAAPFLVSGDQGGEASPLTAILHFTFMQLVSFDLQAKVTIPAEYHDLVEATVISNLSRFQIKFARLVVTRGNILLLGYPNVDVNMSREKLRRVCERTKAPLFEPYKNDIVHMTLIRFASPVSPAQQQQLSAICNAFQDKVLGSLHVDRLCLSTASWRMQLPELVDPTSRFVHLNH